MARFFIDTGTGQVATQRQLVAAGVAPRTGEDPAPPWRAIRGSGDATTLWYAVMRKATRDVHIGALCIRHSDHQALLERQGWREVAVEEIRAFGPAGEAAAGDQAM